MIEISVNIPPHILAMKEVVNTGFSKGIQRVTSKMTQASQQNAPYKTGNLRRSIHAEVASLGGLTGKVIQDTGVAKYGIYVHDGTGLYGPKEQLIIVKPVNKKALFWKGATHPVKQVKIKGMHPRPYMQEAFDQVKSQAEGIIQDSIMREVNG